MYVFNEKKQHKSQSSHKLTIIRVLVKVNNILATFCYLGKHAQIKLESKNQHVSFPP